MTTDRRKPVSRYVLFADGAVQERFTARAEAAYQDLVRLDRWTGQAALTLAAEPSAPRRRGLRRRTARTGAGPESLTVTGGLAAAGETARDVPAHVERLAGCAGEQTLAATMGRVVGDLVRDLAALPVAEQGDHPAYRQTLRLAAELQALDAVLAEVGCARLDGCVRARPPEQWGRREEDVEIEEVRAVLRELAAQDGSPPS